MSTSYELWEKQYRSAVYGPTRDEIAQHNREQAALKKWFPFHREHMSDFIPTALLLESMSQEIERLKAKLAKQDD